MPITIAPNLKTINAFDAEQDKIISFTINGMNIIPKQVQVIILDNNTGEKVYDNTTSISLTNLTHTITKNSLENDKYYVCQIKIISDTNLVSPLSNSVPFYCLYTPIFEFLNVPSVISQSNIDPIIQYSQMGNIYNPLTSFVVKLINSNNQEIYNSNIIYVSENTELQVSISNLEEGNYKLIANGETLNKLSLEIIQEFSVYFNSPSGFSSLFIDNLYDQGQIRITSNIITLIGEVNGEEIYINNSMLDLRNPEYYLEFNKGFLIKDNLYFKIWMKDISLNTKKYFMKMKAADGSTIELYWRKGKFRETNNEDKIFVELRCKTKSLIYTIHSDEYLNVLPENEIYFIAFKKENNLFQVHIERGKYSLLEGGE